jgi:hypothetical protein
MSYKMNGLNAKMKKARNANILNEFSRAKRLKTSVSDSESKDMFSSHDKAFHKQKCLINNLAKAKMKNHNSVKNAQVEK